MLSAKLARAVKEITPATTKLAFADVEALWSLMFNQYPYLRSAGIRLRSHAIEEDHSGQGESSRWGAVIGLPLSVVWESAKVEDRKVIFVPRLSPTKRWGDGWILDLLNLTLAKTTPAKVGLLPEEVTAISGESEVFYCLSSEC